MSAVWWRLPGPAEFVRRTASELREGRNLVLCLPRYLPDGLSDALRFARLSDGDPESWCVLETCPASGPAPTRQIADRLLSY